MLRALMLAAIGGGAFVVVYIATAPQPMPLPETPTETASLGDAPRRGSMPVSFELRPGVSDENGSGGESLGAPIRDVTPANMTSGPVALARATPVDTPLSEEKPDAAARLARCSIG